MLKEEQELLVLGEELRRMRKEMHMTQEKLGEAVEVDPRQLSRYENGSAQMGSLLYRRILRVYEDWKRPRAESLLQQIMKLTPEKRGAIETILCGMQ